MINKRKEMMIGGVYPYAQRFQKYLCLIAALYGK
jgi:hypothetical protein